MFNLNLATRGNIHISFFLTDFITLYYYIIKQQKHNFFVLINHRGDIRPAA